jgi:hypothetical protein
LHAHGMMHGRVEADNVVYFKYPNSGKWWAYRIGNKDVYIRKSGHLFALNNYSQTTETNANSHLEPHCEIVQVLDLFDDPDDPDRRAFLNTLKTIAQDEKPDAAMFMRNAAVLRAFKRYSSLSIDVVAANAERNHRTRQMDRFDILPKGYQPFSGSGDCTKPTNNNRRTDGGSSDGDKSPFAWLLGSSKQDRDRRPFDWLFGS